MHWTLINGLVCLLITLQLAVETQALYCLSCTDVLQPRLCHQVETCSDDEVCVVQKLQYSNGDISFKVGCESALMCHRRKSASVMGVSNIIWRSGTSPLCVDCCTSDICNAEGCGQPGYPPQIGVVCFGCDMTYTPSTCGRLEFCTRDEKCVVQEHWDIVTYYKTGCQKKHMCPAVGVPTQVGKRSNYCYRCCEDNLCNNRCDVNLTTSPTTTPESVRPTVTIPPVFKTTDCGTTPRLLRGDNKGVDFYVATFYLAKLDNRTDSQKPYLSILLEYNTGTCTLSYGNSHTELQLEYGRNVLPLPEEMILTDPGLAQLSDPSPEVFHLNRDVEVKTLHLHCSSAVTVLVVQKGEVNGQASVYEAHLAFPAPLCSTSFVVSSHPNSEYEYNVISVISPAGANVTFHNGKITTAPFNGTATFNVALQSNGVFQLSSLNDLSGTRITSSTPVCVLSSNNCLFNRKGYCSMVIESILPVDDLETHFVVPILIPNYTMSIKIVAAHDNTTVTMVMTNHNANIPAPRSPRIEVVILDSGMYLTQELNSMIDLTIMATKGILVTQLLFGLAPFGLPVPAVTQYKDSYQFDSLVAKETYITIIIENMHNSSSFLQSLVLDDSPLSGSLLSYNTTLACSDYSVFTLMVSVGAHVIHHVNEIPFGLIIHGTQYGFPAGMKFMSTSL